MVYPYASFYEKYFYSDEYLDTLPKWQSFKDDKETKGSQIREMNFDVKHDGLACG